MKTIFCIIGSIYFGLWACRLNQIEYKDQKIKEAFLASK